MRLVDTKICVFCGKKYNKPKGIYGKSWKKRKFCGIKCQHKKQKEDFAGKRLSKKSEFKKGQNSGIKNCFWKNGQWKTSFGYIYKYSPKHPNNSKGYVMEHRLVMEKHIGRFLDKKEVVHHIDKNISNNKINNLVLFPNQSAHAKFHKTHG